VVKTWVVMIRNGATELPVVDMRDASVAIVLSNDLALSSLRVTTSQEFFTSQASSEDYSQHPSDRTD